MTGNGEKAGGQKHSALELILIETLVIDGAALVQVQMCVAAFTEGLPLFLKKSHRL
jgi:hypothetical protein